MKYITNYKKNKNFHTTLINFIYQFKADKSEIMALSIMSKLLSKTSKNYNKEDLFYKEKLNRYILNYNLSFNSLNDVYFLDFALLIPNTNIIKDLDINNEISFFIDSIFNNNLCDNKLFLKEKNLYLESLLNNYKNIEFIAKKSVLDKLDDECIFNKMKYMDIDNINNLKIEDVIYVFNKYVKGVKPRIFVNGNINIDYLENLFTKLLDPLELKSKRIIKDYNYFYNNNSVSNHYLEKCKFYQSIVSLVYVVDNYKEEDFYKLYLLKLLLYSSSSKLLIDTLRKKSNLVYTTSTHVIIHNGLLFIDANTSKENILLVKKMINELIKDLKNINKYKDNISKIIRSYKIEIEKEKDSFLSSSLNIVNKYYNIELSKSDELNIISKITNGELIDLICRLRLLYDYTLEGEL